MINLQTVSASEIVSETLEERFENCVLNKEPFLPDTAIHYVSLRNGEDTDQSALVEERIKLQETADMILDEQMTVEQAWRVFGSTPEGEIFSKKFVKLAEEDKKEQEERGFKNLVVCLDKTNAIINSILNPNGTQYT